MKNDFIKVRIPHLLATGLLFWSLAASAQNIVYNVDRAFADGTIAGTIETDGTLGPLAQVNIVGWSLEAFDGTDVFQITSATGFLQGDAWSFLTATPAELIFDFDAVNASGLTEKLISFHDGDASNSYGYNLVGNLPFVAKGEQIIHQFGEPPNNGEHRVDSPERSVETIAWVDRPTMDCSAPSVSLGEVMAGLQAGLTGGAHTEVGNPGGYYLSAGGEDRRGFIVPDDVGTSEQCENDYILVSGWQGCRVGGFFERTVKEAMDCAADIDGRILEHYIEIDGVRVDHVQTKAKLGTVPNADISIGVITTAVIVEPYSLEPGSHTATVVYSWDGNRDGTPDRDIVLFTDFTVYEATE